MSDLPDITVHFAWPWLLWLALAPMLWLVARRVKQRRDRQRWRLLGEPMTLARFVTGPRRVSWWRSVCTVLAWTMIVVALAGPRWGVEDSPGVAVGRDIVIDIDVSRSMWAEDIADRDAPSRWQAAVAGAKDLVKTCRRGDRLGIVIFAAQPYVVAPLTTDYDHLLQKLDTLNGRHPPAEVRPAVDDAASGTRLGAALAAAVGLHDERFSGFQEIVLFTDGDDPAGDGEWKSGVTAARAAAIPVHVVGLGDPARDSFILRNGEPLEGPTGEGLRAQVQTRLHEDVAKAIAAESRGCYLPACTALPNLAEFYRTAILPAASRELSDERRPQPKAQSAWFYAVAILLQFFVWCWPIRSVY